MYTTVDAVRMVLAPLTPDATFPNPVDSAAGLSDEQLNDAISQAEAKIDSYLGARYAVPVAPIDPTVPTVFPEPISSWAADIAAYRATLTWLRNMPLEPTSPIYLRYADTLRDLTTARDGKSILDLPPSTPVNTGEGFAGVVDDGGWSCIFDANDWGGYNRHVGFGVPYGY